MGPGGAPPVVPAGIDPEWHLLPAGTALARVYYTASGHPLAWNELRGFGPLDFPWDHHLPSGAGEPVEQSRGVMYAAAQAATCLAEMFRSTRRIDRVHQAPWLVVFRTVAPLRLLDLDTPFATRLGLAPAIRSGNRSRLRLWARTLHEAFGDAHGIRYSPGAEGTGPACVLTERALEMQPFPRHPELHRALADDVLLDPLKAAARALGYALR